MALSLHIQCSMFYISRVNNFLQLICQVGKLVYNQLSLEHHQLQSTQKNSSLYASMLGQAAKFPGHGYENKVHQ